MEEWLGQYQLTRRLGDNDLCEAYTALQHGDGGFVREVLVKRLKDALSDDVGAVRAFQGEALLLARLRQRSIPHVYGLQHDPESGSWFIALEFIPGPTLQWVMETERARATPLPMGLAISVVSQLCNALHHLHELQNTNGQPNEFVHRNLAPANVVLGRDGIARLMDFGCAAPRANLDAAGSDGRGTAGYMAPEQILGSQAPDRRADVFVLGVLLYEMATGVRLYDGHGERLRRTLMDVDAPLASTRRAGFPAVLDEVLAGALARDPRARPANAEVFARQIEGFAAAQRIQLGTARVAAYLAEAFPPEEPPRPVAASTPAPSWGFRSSAPPAPRTSQPPGVSHSSAPPPALKWTAAENESTDFDGASLTATAVGEDRAFDGDEVTVGRSQPPAPDTVRPSQPAPRPSTGVYLHVGIDSESVKKKP